MAHILNDALKKDDCTLQEIKSMLISVGPNIKLELNYCIDEELPLWTAISKGKSADIIEELIKHGADVNQWIKPHCIITHVFENFVFSGGKNLDILKLVLQSRNHVYSPLTKLLEEICWMDLDLKLFVPALEITFQHTEKWTKIEALKILCKSVIYYPYPTSDTVERVRKQKLKLIKLLLENGIHLDLDDVNDLIDFLFSGYTVNKLEYVRHLFKLIFPYTVTHMFCENNDLLPRMSNDFCSKIEAIKANKQWDVVTEMCDSLKYLWIQCFEECEKMQRDILTGKCSVLDALKSLRNGEKVPSQVLMEMMIKIYRGEYLRLSNIMTCAVKRGDLIGVYVLLWNSSNVLNPDCFDYIARYLSKDDVFHYLLAILF